MSSKSLKLRMVPISFCSSLEDLFREESFPPECNESDRIQVFWMDAPQSHAGISGIIFLRSSRKYAGSLLLERPDESNEVCKLVRFQCLSERRHLQIHLSGADEFPEIAVVQ